MTQHSELIYDLRSPSVSARLSALYKVSTIERDEELHFALKETLARETDDECLFLLKNVLGEFESSVQEISPALTEDEFRKRWTLGQPTEKMKLLNSLNEESRKRLSSLAPALIGRENHPLCESALIRTFGAWWPEEELVTLVPRLTSKSAAIRTSALEALIERSPQSVISSLPRFLTSEDPGLRVMAVRGLLKTDLEEAVNHLDSMLLEGDLIQRMLALQSAIFFPFRNIRGTLLKFLAAEKESGLLRKAVLLFRMNPDLESPFRVYEIAESAPTEKAALLKEAVKGATQAIKDSGLLEGDLDTYMASLKDWILKRRALRFVQECVTRLTEGPSSGVEELKPLVLKTFNQPYMVVSFRAALRWPISDLARNFIAGILPDPDQGKTPVHPLQTVVPAEPPKQVRPGESPKVQQDSHAPEGTKPQLESRPEAPNQTVPDALTPEEQIRIITEWETGRAQEAKPLLGKILTDASTSPLHWVSALRLALKFGIRDFHELAETTLKDADPGKTALSLEYLAWAKPETVNPLLGRFLKHPHPRVKSAALKILKQDDPQRAISALLLMLKSRQPDERHAACNCLVYFDFDLLREKLCGIIEMGLTPDLVSPILCLFLSNPMPENLYALYRLEQIVTYEQKDLFRKARAQSLEALAGLGGVKPGDPGFTEEAFKARWEAEQTKKARPAPSYSLKAIQARKEAQQASLGEKIGALWQEIPGWFRVGFPVLAIVVLGFHWYLNKVPPRSSEKGRPQALLATPYQASMTVETLSKSGNYLRLKDSKGLRYQISLKEFKGATPREGQTILITLVPYYIDSTQVIHSRLSEIRLPSEDSSAKSEAPPTGNTQKRGKPVMTPTEAAKKPTGEPLPDVHSTEVYPTEVHPTLVERFNQAAALARKGNNIEALKLYESVFSPVEGGKTGPYVPRFFFMVHLQKAYCLMDLGKYAEAEDLLTRKEMMETIAAMPPLEATNFHFALGNISGNLKKFAEMAKNLRKAISLCPEEEKELQQQNWHWLMTWARESKDWPLLESLCREIHQIGQAKQNFRFQLMAMEFGAHAFLGLGDKGKARRQAEKIQEWFTQAQNEEKIKEWKEFLGSIK